MAIRVLFVCLGNICRSPSAEGVFRELVTRANLEGQIEIDSAGTGAWHIGNAPDRRAQKVASERGFEIADLKARQVGPNDFQEFDVIIAMDEDNRKTLLAACPPDHKYKVSLLLDHTASKAGQNVPDPYYGGKDGFYHMFDLIESGSQGLLDHLVRKHLS